MIDAATQQIEALKDKFQYNPDDNTYSDPNNPTKVYTPKELTDMKNAISTKLDQALAKAKLRPLGVRFDPKSAGSANVQQTFTGKDSQGNEVSNTFYVPPGQAAPSQAAPKSVAEVQKGQDYNGYTYLGGNKADKNSWKKAGQ